MFSKSFDERFWEKVFKTTTCWIWTGATAHHYGQIKRDGKKVGAHIVSFELANGELPTGMKVLHKCDNPLCVRPDHLFSGTLSDNMVDCVAKGRHYNPMLNGAVHGNTKKTHCAKGHEYTDENTYHVRGERQCKLCRRDANRRYHQSVGV